MNRLPREAADEPREILSRKPDNATQYLRKTPGKTNSGNGAAKTSSLAKTAPKVKPVWNPAATQCRAPSGPASRTAASDAAPGAANRRPSPAGLAPASKAARNGVVPQQVSGNEPLPAGLGRPLAFAPAGGGSEPSTAGAGPDLDPVPPSLAASAGGIADRIKAEWAAQSVAMLGPKASTG